MICRYPYRDYPTAPPWSGGTVRHWRRMRLHDTIWPGRDLERRRGTMRTVPVEAVYRFGQFSLDLARGALLGGGGAEIPLRRKSFELLHLFVRNGGRLLDRDTINQAIWPDVAVT